MAAVMHALQCHQLKDGERTHDDLTLTYLQQVDTRKHVAKDCITRFQTLGKSINSHLEILLALSQDLRRLDTPAGNASADQFANAAATLRAEFERMQPVIKSESDRLTAYVETCHAVEKAKQDWKTKRDNYDLQRKKVTKLHDKPAKDAAKAAAKEQKLANDDKEYHDANRYLQTLALDCANNGNATICDTANTVASALSRNYSAITFAVQSAQPEALQKQAAIPPPTLVPADTMKPSTFAQPVAGGQSAYAQSEPLQPAYAHSEPLQPAYAQPDGLQKQASIPQAALPTETRVG